MWIGGLIFTHLCNTHLHWEINIYHISLLDPFGLEDKYLLPSAEPYHIENKYPLHIY
jgi:hypothetical protein